MPAKESNKPRFAVGRVIAPKLWEDERQHAKDFFDHQFKSFGYLLTAHAAGLAGSVSILKDSIQVPQLKGTGFFVACFWLGFIFAVLAYVALSIHRDSVMRVFVDGAPDKDTIWRELLMAYIPAAASIGLLLLAVVGIIYRSIWF